MLLEEESPAYEDGSALASSLGSPVIIVQVRSHSPDWWIFPVLPEPGKGERASVFHGEERTAASA
jgi:hypothetical protein